MTQTAFGHSSYKGKQTEIIEAAVLGSFLSTEVILLTHDNHYRDGCPCLGTYWNGEGGRCSPYHFGDGSTDSVLRASVFKYLQWLKR
jgi:hypothetical protein